MRQFPGIPCERVPQDDGPQTTGGHGPARACVCLVDELAEILESAAKTVFAALIAVFVFD